MYTIYIYVPLPIFFQHKDEIRLCRINKNIEFYALLMLMLFLPLIECFFLCKILFAVLHKEYTYML